jgi:ribosomal protein S26
MRVFSVAVAHRVVQDKSVKRFMVRNMVETAAHRDLKDASVYESTCGVWNERGLL